MAVGEPILIQDVKNVFFLMNPQLPGAPVALKLDAEVLRDGPHVCDAKSHMQATLCLAKEETVVTASHAIIDMPGQQAPDFIPAEEKDGMIGFAPGKPLPLKFFAQYLVELVSCLLDTIQ